MSLIDYFRSTKKGISGDEARELIGLIRSMKSRFTEGGRVTFSDMENIPFAENEDTFFEPAPNIKCYRLGVPDPKIILFYVVMLPGSSFGTHDHDCIEWSWVISGEAEVDGNNETPMKMLTFPPYTEHTFKTKIGCELIVAFGKESHDQPRS